MKALICLNGDRPEKRLVAQCASECETVICADGALQYLLDANIFPDLWLGDMDSVSPERLSEAKARGIIPKTYPMQKDYTDGQLAVKEAIASGADELLYWVLWAEGATTCLKTCACFMTRAAWACAQLPVRSGSACFSAGMLLSFRRKTVVWCRCCPIRIR